MHGRVMLSSNVCLNFICKCIIKSIHYFIQLPCLSSRYALVGLAHLFVSTSVIEQG